MVECIYAGGAFGFDGKGYAWHRHFKFPSFPKVTKTVTLHPKVGNPFAVMHLGNSIWNRVAHHNMGIKRWLKSYYNENLILSIAGTDEEIDKIIRILDNIPLMGVQLSYSCPNVESHGNKVIPKCDYDIYLKLNHTQNPYSYDLDLVKNIFINSVSCGYGAFSGKLAQKKNWDFIKRYPELKISGCSFTSEDDLNRLIDMGCESVSIGSTMLINPWLVERMEKYRGDKGYEY